MPRRIPNFKIWSQLGDSQVNAVFIERSYPIINGNFICMLRMLGKEKDCPSVIKKTVFTFNQNSDLVNLTMQNKSWKFIARGLWSKEYDENSRFKRWYLQLLSGENIIKIEPITIDKDYNVKKFYTSQISNVRENDNLGKEEIFMGEGTGSILDECRSNYVLIPNDDPTKLYAFDVGKLIQCDGTEWEFPVLKINQLKSELNELLKNEDVGTWELCAAGIKETIHGGDILESKFVHLLPCMQNITLSSGNTYELPEKIKNLLTELEKYCPDVAAIKLGNYERYIDVPTHGEFVLALLSSKIKENQPKAKESMKERQLGGNFYKTYHYDITAYCGDD